MGWGYHTGINFGAVAFWFFIAACVAISAWEKTRREAQRHETLRRIIEKTGAIDEARMKELFQPVPNSPWQSHLAGSGNGYRGLRVAGTIVLFVAAGLAVFFSILLQAGVVPQNAAIIGLACASMVAILGFGLWVASRFFPPPTPGSPGEPPAH